MSRFHFHRYLAVTFILFLLAGCNGVSGTGAGGEDPEVSGIAAEGKAIGGAKVTLKDCNGTKKSANTDSTGHFKINVKDLKAPFILNVDNDKGRRFFSIATKEGVANLNPYSDVVARNWFGSRGRNIEQEFDSNDIISNPPLETQVTALISAIKSLLVVAFQKFNVQSDFNFINSSFAADGTHFDQLLDQTLIKIDNGKITIKLKDPETGFLAIIILEFNLSDDLTVTDTTPPTTPTGLTAFAASSTSAVVVWNSSQDEIGVAGYNIYRDDKPNQIWAISAFPVFSDTNLTTGAPVCYTVEAFDGAGNTSPKATQACVTPPNDPDTTAPSAASGLTATASGTNQINLTWTPSQDNDVLGYDIYRGPAGSLDTKIATAISSNYEDFNLVGSTEYCYKVVAFDAAGNRSTDSNEACASTPAPNPPVVDGTTPTNTSTPTWTWSSGGGGNGNFRYKLDDANLDTGATETRATSFTPAAALTEGAHTLYVQEQNSTLVWSASGSHVIVIDITAPTTTATPAGGTYDTAQSVTLSCTDPGNNGCTIYYTTDGNDPDTNSNVYSSVIAISTDTILKFFAVDGVDNQEAIHTETYTINAPLPPNPPIVSGASRTNNVTPTWTWTSGGGGNGNFRYKLDDANLDTGATEIATMSFTPAALPEGPHTLYVQEQNSALVWSGSGSHEIVIDVTAPTSSALPAGGTYTSAQSVTLSCNESNSGCSVYYTTDGSDPTTGSTQYSAAIDIISDTTLKFLAVDSAGNQEAFHTETYTITGSPLAFDVSVLSTPVKSDGRLFFSITVSNTSLLQTVNNVNVSYTVPAGLQFAVPTDMEPGLSNLCSGNVCNEGETPQWVFPSIASGASKTIHINAQVLTGQVDGNSIISPFTVSATELTSPITINKTVQINNTPSTQLAISANKDPVMPGETYTLNVDMGNIGGLPLTNTVLHAFLPTGVTVESVSDGGVDNGNGEVVWDLSASSVGVGVALHREVVITAPTLASNVSTDILKATAQLTFDGGAAVDEIAEHVVTVLNTAPATPVVLFDISTAQSPAIAGGRLLYTMTVSNVSFQTINNVQVIYRVPAGIQFAVPTDMEPALSNLCSGNVCNEGEEPTWTFPTLAAGASKTITVNASVLAGVEQVNGALISAPIRVTADELADTMSLLHTVPIDNTASAQLAISASKDPVMPGETYTLNVDMGNISALPLTNTVLRAVLPAGVTVVSVSDGGVDNGNGEVVWDLSASSVGVGVALHREVVITAPALANNVTTDILKASAQLTFDGGAEVDEIAEHVVTVLNTAPATPVVLFDISTAQSPAIAGGRLLYTMTVSNVSFQTINNVQVIYRVPAGIQFAVPTDMEPALSNLCSGNVCNEGEEPTWTFPTLAAGASKTITVNASVLAGVEQVNGALISAPIRVTADELADTMSLLHTVPIDNTASAQLAISASKDPVMPGETYTLNVDMGNISALPLTNTVLRAVLPAGVTVVSVSDGGVDNGNGEVVWDLSASSVGVGVALHREVVITAPALANNVTTDILKASAQLTFDGGAEVDEIAEHAVTVLNNNPPLGISVAATPNPVAAGGVLSYTITVSNLSAVTINNVAVIYRVPTSIQFAVLTDIQPGLSNICSGNVCNAGEEALWTFTTIGASSSQTITIDATVLSGATQVNGALISAPIWATADELADTISILSTVSINTP